jgi:hypothetical protein
VTDTPGSEAGARYRGDRHPAKRMWRSEGLPPAVPPTDIAKVIGSLHSDDTRTNSGGPNSGIRQRLIGRIGTVVPVTFCTSSRRVNVAWMTIVAIRSISSVVIES